MRQCDGTNLFETFHGRGTRVILYDYEAANARLEWRNSELLPDLEQRHATHTRQCTSAEQL